MNTAKFGHITIWTVYFKLATMLTLNDHMGISHLLTESGLPADYLYKMIRYFFTGNRADSPIGLKAIDSFYGLVQTRVTSFSEDNFETQKIKGSKKLADNAISSYRQLIAKTDPKDDNAMTLLSFVSALLVKSGVANWKDVNKETALESAVEFEQDGETIKAFVKTQLLDLESPQGETYFTIAKNMEVVSITA